MPDNPIALFFYIINWMADTLNGLTIAGIRIEYLLISTIGLGGAVELLVKKGNNV